MSRSNPVNVTKNIEIMKDQKHTAGNWNLNNNSMSPKETRFSVTINDNHGYAVIATITDDNNMFGRKEVEANAKLIAAAPQLLEISMALWKALQQEMCHLPADRQQVISSFLEYSQRVIKKATE